MGPYSRLLFCCLGYVERMLIEGNFVLCMVCVLGIFV